MLTAFTVRGRPVPWERIGGTGRSSYVPARTAAWKERVGWAARQAHRGRPVAGRVTVAIAVHLMPGAAGDVDNYAKAILDAMTGVVYLDDQQVRRLVVEVVDDCATRADERAVVTVSAYARRVSTTPTEGARP